MRWLKAVWQQEKCLSAVCEQVQLKMGFRLVDYGCFAREYKRDNDRIFTHVVMKRITLQKGVLEI